jgi:hypothetical protein
VFSPTSATLNQGGGAITVYGAYNFIDNGADLAGGSVTVKAYDFNNNLISTTNTPLTGNFTGVTTGTLSGPSTVSTTVAGTFHFVLYITDGVGNKSNELFGLFTVTAPVTDTIAPVVSTFSLPATATSLTVAVSSFTATDNVGVSGYLITESATPPSASAIGWSITVPPSYTFSASGPMTAYAWARDAAGNVSASRSATVSIALPDTSSYSIADALLALQIGSGQVAPTSDQVTRLDVAPVVNGTSMPNGEVNTGDAIVLLSKIVGKPVL